MKCVNKDIPSRKESQLKYPDGISDNILKPIMTKSKSSHQNKKTLSPFYQKKVFLIENECKTPWVSYIHFLSKIFFMIKRT